MIFDPQRDLTRKQQELFDLLLKSDVLYMDRAMIRLYGHLVAPPDPMVIRVMICTLRKKLAKFGIGIDTVHGRGYKLPQASREKLRLAMMPERMSV